MLLPILDVIPKPVLNPQHVMLFGMISKNAQERLNRCQDEMAAPAACEPEGDGEEDLLPPPP
eukprot:5468437-Lingulodinium_polyedra.AAC.1